MKLLSKERLGELFDSALAQYRTLDKKKHETFGPMVQGFYATKNGRDVKLAPFAFYNDAGCESIRSEVESLETEQLGISLTQKYLHYTFLK